jgi:hypothetical protein
MFDVVLIAPDVQLIPRRTEVLLLDAPAQFFRRYVAVIAWIARPPNRIEHVGVRVVDWCAGEDQPMIRCAFERTDGTAQPDVSVGAVGTPAPAVERALDAVTDHRAAVTDLRAEVLAVGLADRKLGGPPDHEPPGDLTGERDFHAGASRIR